MSALASPEGLIRYLTTGGRREVVLVVTSISTGVSYTYRVRRAPETDKRTGRAARRRCWFVRVDDGHNGIYLGRIADRGDPEAVGGDRPSDDDHPNPGPFLVRGRMPPSAAAFAWLWRNVRPMPTDQRRYGTPPDGRFPSGVEVRHDGRCSRCGRALTDPESIDVGMGPICRAKAS